MFGENRNSNIDTPDIIRGMPWGQARTASSPWPPVSWSAMLASKRAWYLGLGGASCLRIGLLWSPP
jgi:hypothetical protein